MSINNIFDIFQGIGYNVVSMEQGCSVDGPITDTIHAIGFGNNILMDKDLVMNHLKAAGLQCQSINIDIRREMYNEFTLGNRVSQHVACGPMTVSLTVDVTRLSLSESETQLETETIDNSFNLDGAL